jgi:isopenicillin-N N-acyltransferase-like protein
MEHLILEGSWFETGRTQGERFSEDIRRMAEGLGQSFRSKAILEALSSTVGHIDNCCPQINEEIRGIAEGAGIPFEQAFLLSNRSILEWTADDCSHAAMIKDGRVVVGMNKDSKGQQPSDFFVASIRPERGHSSVGYRHVGRVWGYSVNDCGLCAAGTSAQPRNPREPMPAVGLYFVGPIVSAACATVQEAIDLMAHLGPIAGSGNVLLADEHTAAVVEFAPGQTVVRHAQNGMIASTNFYASGMIEDAENPPYLAETRARYQNILSLMASEETSVVGMQRILAFHAERGSVCRHDPSTDQTVFSYVASPADRRFYIASGPPCEHEYVPYETP